MQKTKNVPLTCRFYQIVIMRYIVSIYVIATRLQYTQYYPFSAYLVLHFLYVSHAPNAKMKKLFLPFDYERRQLALLYAQHAEKKNSNDGGSDD